jgi:hypothetical protein
MLKLLAFFFLLICSTSFAEPCTPTERSYACKKYEAIMGKPFAFVKIPVGYFSSPHAGIQRAWLVPTDSKGTWRMRIMQWGKQTPDEAHTHFHQVAHSDLLDAGPLQYVEFEGPAGLYRHEVECEDDCVNKPFNYYILTP